MKSHERHTRSAAPYTTSGTSESAIRMLLDALGHARADATMDELHAAVCERVRAMRNEGALPEAVLVAMKRVATSAVGESGAARSARAAETGDLVSQIGQWCITEYFRRT